jgi:hypothetical protein
LAAARNTGALADISTSLDVALQDLVDGASKPG